MKNTAIKSTKKDMMPQVMTHTGEQKDKHIVYSELVSLNPNDPYRKQKASGSIGGSVTNRYIQSVGSTYVRRK